MVDREKIVMCLYFHFIGAMLFTACFLLVLMLAISFNALDISDPSVASRVILSIILFLPISFGITLPFLPITYKMGNFTDDQHANTP